MTPVVLPGATIGILGSGQLGRMLALAARQMGYGVAVYSPDADAPAGQVADREVIGAYDDVGAIAAFAGGVSVVTFEFENISSAAAAAAASATVVRPAGAILHMTQERVREKTWLAAHRVPTAAFAPASTAAELDAAIERIGTPAVIKTAAFGYDGKGQVLVSSADEARAAWASLRGVPAIVEAFVDFTCEVSVIVARSVDGTAVDYGVVENAHVDHILDVTRAPARVPPSVAETAVSIARETAEAIGLVGVLAVEMFVTGHGEVVVNELAPRPHNSGHFTIDACVTSQFGQQLRTVCGLAPGDTRQHRPAAMANLLGDLWQDGEPDWAAVAGVRGVSLHLYGKREPRRGRKMGHLTAMADSVDDAAALVLEARARLRRVR